MDIRIKYQIKKTNKYPKALCLIALAKTYIAKSKWLVNVFIFKHNQKVDKETIISINNNNLLSYSKYLGVL